MHDIAHQQRPAGRVAPRTPGTRNGAIDCGTELWRMLSPEPLLRCLPLDDSVTDPNTDRSSGISQSLTNYVNRLPSIGSCIVGTTIMTMRHARISRRL